MILLFILILAAIGAHVLWVDLDPVHICITVAVIGVLYNLSLALIHRFIWPKYPPK